MSKFDRDCFTLSKFFVAALFFIPILSYAIIYFVASIKFEIDIGSYLKRSADANTTEMAIQELDKALVNIESKGLTSGSTHVYFYTPEKDVGFWYQNIKTAREELYSLPDNASALEKSNMLIKLRETLLDHTAKGDAITVPSEIQFFPHNLFFENYFWLSGLLGVVTIIYMFLKYGNL